MNAFHSPSQIKYLGSLALGKAPYPKLVIFAPHFVHFPPKGLDFKSENLCLFTLLVLVTHLSVYMWKGPQL